MASLHPFAQAHVAQGIAPALPPSLPEASPVNAHLPHGLLHQNQPHRQSQHQQHILLQRQQQQVQQQLQQQQQQLNQQHRFQQQMEYQRMQNMQPFPPSSTADSSFSACPFSNLTLQQRLASGQLSALALSDAAGQYPPQARVHTQPQSLTPHGRWLAQPLTPQDWQGLVASGAQPVRQALHSFIAASCEKPPETKEEARAVLEVMFQIRAGKIRRAIEEGQLATAEALQHRVIQRRESIEGSLKNSRRKNGPSRALSAPSETKIASDASIVRGWNSLVQHWPHSQMTDGPDMIIDPAAALPAALQEGMMDMTSVDTGLFGEQASTFGLSDDDLMLSFTTFTAKLGDSLLANNDSSLNHNPNFGGALESAAPNTERDQYRMRAQTHAPSLSPPSLAMERSPTISSESQSPSPWMPWTSVDASLSTDPSHQQQAFGVQAGTLPVPLSQQLGGMPVNMQQMYSGVAQTYSASTEQQLAGSQLICTPGGTFALGDKQNQQQNATWSQYMQYLLHQEQGVQLSDQGAVQQQHQHYPQLHQQPYSLQQQPLDPHLQATMMAMMMDQNSHMESIGGPNTGLWTTPARAAYQGQLPSL